LSFLAHGIHAIFSQILYLFKQTKFDGAVWTGAALLNLLLNLFLIPSFGILGAALSTFVVFATAMLIVWRRSLKYLSFPIPWIPIGKSLVASLLMGLMILFVNPEGLRETLATVFAAALFYGIIIILIKGIEKKEIQFILKLLK